MPEKGADHCARAFNQIRYRNDLSKNIKSHFFHKYSFHIKRSKTLTKLVSISICCEEFQLNTPKIGTKNPPFWKKTPLPLSTKNIKIYSRFYCFSVLSCHNSIYSPIVQSSLAKSRNSRRHFIKKQILFTFMTGFMWSKTSIFEGETLYITSVCFEWSNTTLLIFCWLLQWFGSLEIPQIALLVS